jgi:hypothetical protein
MMKSITKLTPDISPMIKFDVDSSWYCFSLQLKWMLAIRSQLSALSVWDFDRLQPLPHSVQ